jgi:hypothetical protein
MSGFPYWKFSLPESTIMFENLKIQHVHTERDSDDNDIVIRRYPEDYEVCDHITNHFTEKIRINCRFSNYKTPYEVWTEIKKNKEYKQLVNPKDKREHIYGLTKECNTFNPTYCLYIINKLTGSGAKILDPSSGWGDRLIAAIASGAEIYHGFDPNKKLQSAYKNIIKTFNANSKNVSVKAVPFEDSKIKDNFYDLAITSPPYFTLEQYSDDSTQSVVRYDTYEKWINLFYKPYILKMIDAIRVGGYISIYIEDITVNKQKYNLRQLTMTIMNNDERVQQRFKIGLKIGNPRWSIVWQKVN